MPKTPATNREWVKEQTESNDTLSTSRLNTIIKVHKTSFNLTVSIKTIAVVLKILVILDIDIAV